MIRQVTFGFLISMMSSCLSLLAFSASPSFHIHTPPLFQVDLEKTIVVRGHALVSGCPEHWTIQSYLKYELKCTVWSQCTSVPDRQTDGQANMFTL